MVSNFCKTVSTAHWGQLERKSMQVPKSEVMGKEASDLQCLAETILYLLPND